MAKMVPRSNIRPAVVDFETLPIDSRPCYPPAPVGVSVRFPGKKSKYYAFGHPTGNNSTWAEARAAVAQAYACKDGVLFHHGKFDLDVAEVHLGLAPPPWQQTHDTLFLVFLDDPNQPELGLKPSAERLLGLPAEERDAMVEWLLERQPLLQAGIRLSASVRSEHYAGAYVAYAPGQLAGEYAVGDTDRTHDLFHLLYPKILERGMAEAYARERELMHYLLDMERQGVPINVKALQADVASYNAWRQRIDTWAIKKLKAPADINLNSGDQLVKAGIAAGLIDETRLGVTPTGKPKSDKDSLHAAVSDAALLAVLKYRAQLNTCLNTFMIPWLQTALRSGGLIFTSWNQVKAGDGPDAVGARTGRLSSTPNFQNIPKEFSPLFKHEEPDPKKAKALPALPAELKGLPPLPRVRTYVVPFEGEIFIDRDYSQQEPRILAHFDGGALMRKYLEDPWIDFHDFAKSELEKVGKFYERKPVKNTNLGLIYGMGIGKLAQKNDMPVDEAKELKTAILKLYPGLAEMYKDMKQRAIANQPLRTWGGREYYCEPPKIVDGHMRTFDYKMVNSLIQGSAADCTKEAIIRFYRAKLAGRTTARLLLNVHDQLTASAQKKTYKTDMEVMRETMESVEFDVPILSEGAISDVSWGHLVDYDKKGVVLNGN